MSEQWVRYRHDADFRRMELEAIRRDQNSEARAHQFALRYSQPYSDPAARQWIYDRAKRWFLAQKGKP